MRFHPQFAIKQAALRLILASRWNEPRLVTRRHRMRKLVVEQ